MFFASDNWAGAHPGIARRLLQEFEGYAVPYAESALDRKIEKKISEIFERKVAVFCVATGTAANSLALASVGKIAGLIFCHAHAHIIEHEGGAVEHMTSGAKLIGVHGNGRQPGKMDPARLQAAINRYPASDLQIGQKMAVSISQSTEAGTFHSIEEISQLAAIAHAHGLPVHMDGARFANALVALNVSPAEMTWKAGIDILALGGTKNGCWCAEAIVVMDPDKAGIVPYLRKRGGHLFSKNRFVAAQLDAWLDNDLWLDLARHANQMADQLRAGISASAHMRLAWQTSANQIFVVMKKQKAETLWAAGAHFHPASSPDDFALDITPDEGIYRLVTCYSTQKTDIDQFCRLAG